VLVISQIGTLAGYILLALSNTLWLIFVARIIDGLTAGNISVAHAYVSDNTPPDPRCPTLDKRFWIQLHERVYGHLAEGI
jgi:MFS family permease